MRIAVDAMGGDFAPREIVKGSVLAARELPLLERLFLVGDEAAIKAELAACGPVPDKIEIRHASQVVAMDEPPAQAVRRKRDSSIGRAVDMVKSGEARAVVSAGSTGAAVVAATLKLRAIEGVERPAIAAVMPGLTGPFVLVDAGANTDCTPRWVAQFAVMGSVYSRLILGRASPVVGLLSIGDEDTKGNETTKETFGLLNRLDLNFRGNVEGHDLFEGETDVIACDGFVGNVVLKTSESVARAIGHWLKAELTASAWRKAGALMLKGAWKSLKRKLDPELYGGAPLLGVNGVCIITHGASSSLAILHAVRVACESVDHNLNDTLVAEIAKMNEVCP